MTWEEACATLLALKVGAKVRKASRPGEVRLWEVRGVIEADLVVVLRRWVSQRRGYTYAVEHPEAFEVGLFTVPKRPSRSKKAAAESDHRRAMFCEHANEVPQACPCPPSCYCKDHTCCYREAR
jgi:hypothetical protein